jgi:phospholipid transport system substrate-binding protein
MTPLTHMTSWIDRRGVLLGLGALIVMPSSGLAMTQAQARDLIGRVMNEVQAIVSSGRDERGVSREFEGLFSRHGDVSVIARSVLGPAARSASPAQLTAFTAGFQSYMARKYGRQFRRFAGAQADVTGARQVQSYWEVVSTMTMRGEAPFEVRWQVSDRSGQHKFFNLIIEGVNLLSAERQEIGTMLERRGGSIDRLIEDLRRAG